MTDQLDRLKENLKKGENYAGLVEALIQGNPDARERLENDIREEIPQVAIGVNSHDGLITRFGAKLAKRRQRLGIEAFLENPAIAITDARSEYGDKFRDNYLAVSPQEIGDAQHDGIVKDHKRLNTLVGALDSLKKDSPIKYNEFISKTARSIKEDVKDDLGEDREGLVDLVVAAYVEADPNQAMGIASYVATKTKERIEQNLPEDRRAGYAEANLRKITEQDANKGALELHSLIR